MVAPVADCLAARGPCRTCASSGRRGTRGSHLLWSVVAAAAAAARLVERAFWLFVYVMKQPGVAQIYARPQTGYNQLVSRWVL